LLESIKLLNKERHKIKNLKTNLTVLLVRKLKPNIEIIIYLERKEMAKKDRQTELKSVLFETMKLTNTLKSQLEKFEKAGLVYDHHPSKY